MHLSQTPGKTGLALVAGRTGTCVTWKMRTTTPTRACAQQSRIWKPGERCDITAETRIHRWDLRREFQQTFLEKYMKADGLDQITREGNVFLTSIPLSRVDCHIKEKYILASTGEIQCQSEINSSCLDFCPFCGFL